MNYKSKPPKTARAAQRAWEAFAAAMGGEPSSIGFGYSSEYGGMIWTSETWCKWGIEIWGYSRHYLGDKATKILVPEAPFLGIEHRG